MTLVLMTWLWTTALSGAFLMVLIGLQRLLVGPAAPSKRPSPVLDGLTGTSAVAAHRELQAHAA